MFFLFDKPLNRDKTNCVLTTNQWCTLSTKTVIALDWDVNLDKNKPATGIYSYIISEKFVGVRIRPQSLFWFKWGLQYASCQLPNPTLHLSSDEKPLDLVRYNPLHCPTIWHTNIMQYVLYKHLAYLCSVSRPATPPRHCLCPDLP